ncbi:MAG: hypothetical protein RML94_04030 [Bacteroidia bacterium]|nr:hypothetical protein [Bacteroidia bacterium]
MPIILKASDVADEVVSCNPYIKPCSTVLTLNYDFHGRTVDDHKIADKVYLFIHVGCYLGQYKPLVLSDNYETNTWYFPLISKWQTEMYSNTEKEGVKSDHNPPRADILNYKNRTGQELDYVLLLFPFNKMDTHEYTQEIKYQLSKAYMMVYTSKSGRVVLYEKIK